MGKCRNGFLEEQTYFTKTTQKRLASLGVNWLMPPRLVAFSFLGGHHGS